MFLSTLRQQVFGIWELVAWQLPKVVHQGGLSKSFVVDSTALTPQQSSYRKPILKRLTIHKDKHFSYQSLN